MKLKPLPGTRRAARVAAEAGTGGLSEPATEPFLSPAESFRPDADPFVMDGTAEPERQPSDVRGLIDNATPDRLFGWAWDATHPGQRLKVELRLAGEIIANTVADFMRPDLAKNGIGDGRHAFEFPLLPDWVDRHRELTAVAFGVDGSEFPIAVRIRRLDDAQVATQLQRLVEAAMAEQQTMRDEFAALRDNAAALPQASAVAAIGASQSELTEKVRSLEVWLSRLDAKLGDGARRGDAAPEGSRLDPWQAALIATLAAVASAALALAAARHLLLG